MWSGPAGAASLAVITFFDKSAAAPGNRTMIALAGGDPETVQAVHAKALAMGGADGAAAWRAQSTTNSFAPALVLERCGSAPSAT